MYDCGNSQLRKEQRTIAIRGLMALVNVRRSECAGSQEVENVDKEVNEMLELQTRKEVNEMAERLEGASQVA